MTFTVNGGEGGHDRSFDTVINDISSRRVQAESAGATRACPETIAPSKTPGDKQPSAVYDEDPGPGSV